MPHPAVGVHALRCHDDLCDGKVHVVCVANARSDAAETSKCSMDLWASHTNKKLYSAGVIYLELKRYSPEVC